MSNLSHRPETQAILDTIGGTEGESVRARASQVENTIYKIIDGAFAPHQRQLPPEAIALIALSTSSA